MHHLPLTAAAQLAEVVSEKQWLHIALCQWCHCNLFDALSFALADEDEGLLLMRPVYGKFENDFSIQSRLKMLYVESEGRKFFAPDIVKSYESRLAEAEAEGVNVKALLLCNPHNPSGLCYPVDTLLAILRFCSSHGLHVISDEIYALSTFPTTRTAVTFKSVLSLDLAGVIDPGSVHVLYGMSKDFGVPGLHLGSLITRNEQLQSAFEDIGLIHTPSGLSYHVGSLILEDSKFVENVIGLSRQKLSENYALVTRMLDEAGIEYWRGGSAGFFLWVNVSALLDGDGSDAEEKMGEKFRAQGLWLNPGVERGEHRGWVRVIISHDKVKLEEGIRRLIKTWKTVQHQNPCIESSVLPP
ncbi:hypothetical protein HYALB_00003985 [Hymenoscyphus albidus]|uniref:Aminotransferase class I/classII large domain-containing protein n=1 Tax=Hymenoscyphus albidus TaxID=595503 RepID=A0A9N9LSD3_9HELO|nr:hypothetical protein HYALB_00003985 [Hymenoscyphus albidus]